MDLTIITKLVSVILAVSLASERLVAFITTFIPQLAAPQPPGSADPNSKKEKWRKGILMLIAFVAGWIAISFNDGDFHPWHSLDLGMKEFKIPFFIIGLMASGGSAFWTSLLGYIKAIRDVNMQKNIQEGLRTRAQIAHFEQGRADFMAAGTEESNLRSFKTIMFTATFSGGLGTAKIQFAGFPDINFSGSGSQSVHLPLGRIDYVISGATAPVGGSLTIDITGPVVSNAPHQFGPGLILPGIHSMQIS